MMIRTGRLRSIGVIAFVSGLMVAGCGDSEPSEDEGASTTSTPAGSTESPIVIGSVISQSGSAASSSAGMPELLNAWATWVNTDKGGINGRPVEVKVVDDASTSATGVQAVQELVNEDDVIAFVGGLSTASETAFAPYLEQQKIPYISGLPFNTIWTESPVFFPVTMTVPASLHSKALLAKEVGATKWGALVCAELPACDVSSIWEAESETLGLPYAGVVKISASAANYSSACIQMKDQGVDYLQIGVAPAQAARVVRDCEAQGYHPKYGITQLSWDPSFLELTGAQIYGDAYGMPWYFDSPALADYEHVVSTYLDLEPTSWQSAGLVATFSALEVFRAAMSGVTAAEPTGSDVLQAMTTLDGNNLGGLLANEIGGFNAGTGPQPAVSCFFVAEISDGELAQSRGTAPICPSQG